MYNPFVREILKKAGFSKLEMQKLGHLKKHKTQMQESSLESRGNTVKLILNSSVSNKNKLC